MPAQYSRLIQLPYLVAQPAERLRAACNILNKYSRYDIVFLVDDGKNSVVFPAIRLPDNWG